MDQFETTRWDSPRFRIYSSHCKKAKTMNEIENCTLEDYSFGDGLSKKYDITSQQLSSERACSDRCENEKNCTFFWSTDENQIVRNSAQVFICSFYICHEYFTAKATHGWQYNRLHSFTKFNFPLIYYFLKPLSFSILT